MFLTFPISPTYEASNSSGEIKMSYPRSRSSAFTSTLTLLTRLRYLICSAILCSVSWPLSNYDKKFYLSGIALLIYAPLSPSAFISHPELCPILEHIPTSYPRRSRTTASPRLLSFMTFFASTSFSLSLQHLMRSGWLDKIENGLETETWAALDNDLSWLSFVLIDSISWTN